MEDIDAEFGPIRKTHQTISSDQIIKDVRIDHEQQSVLRKIKLTRGDMEQNEISTRSIQDTSRVFEIPTVVQEAQDNVYEPTVSAKRTHDSIPNESVKRAKLLKAIDKEFEQFRNFLIRKLNNSLPAEQVKLPSHIREASDEVERILKQSIIQKESHSAIIVGPRSRYKTATVNHHLSILAERFEKQFVTIRLNGFIHTENAAINSIAHQLETQLSELHGSSSSKFEISSGSLTEVFEKILRLIDTTSVQREKSTSTRSEKISVVFIFDEIDTFAGPVRQTLLYNLFDMVEHARVPVCILGCTTKLNIVEYLEKRVKSRFSQRIIYMPPIESYEEFLTAFKEEVCVNLNNCYANGWNAKIEKLLELDSSALSKLVRNNFETLRSVGLLKTSLIPMVVKERSHELLLNALESCSSVIAYNGNQLSNSLTAKLMSLSDLEIALLIAAARVSLRNDDSVNFNLSYAEYSCMVKELNKKIPMIPPAVGGTLKIDNTVRIWSKKDVKNVWENIIALDFLTEKGAVGLRASALAAFQASNYHTSGTIIPFDLRTYQMQITLGELRRIVPNSSMYYSWTQL